jgi:potassium efflux system protein
VQSKRLVAYWIQLVVIVVCLGQSHAALPQKASKPVPLPAKQEGAQAISPEAIERKIAELDQKIKTSQEAANEQTAQQLGVDLALLQKRTVLLQELREVYNWWSVNLAREAVLQKEKTALADKLATLKERGVKEPPPYSLSFLENLLSQLQFFEQRQEAYALSSSIFLEYLNTLQEERDEAGKKWRLLQDKLAAATLPEVKRKLQFKAEIAQLERELAEKEYLSVKTFSNLIKMLQEMANLQMDVYREQSAWVRKHLRIQDRDLEQKISLLGQKQKKLADKRAELQRVLRQKTRTWEKVDKESGSAKGSDAVQEELSQERQTWQQTHQSTLDSIIHHLTMLRSQEALWKKRVALLKNEATQEQLVKWQADLDKKREFGRKYYKYLGNQNVSLQTQVAALEKRLATPGLDPGIKDILSSQKAACLAFIQENNAMIQALADIDELGRRFSEEIGARLAQDPWSSFWTRLRVSFKRLMTFEIWVIDKQSVTVSKFLRALAFLILGLLLARIILHYLIYPLLEKTLWRHTKAEIIKKTFSYLVYTIVFLITLGRLHIPLQSFATLGGGIAIGLGFAAQTIIKNFISGFILLGEKPIEIGDLVEVGGIVGNVQDISSRSTLLRTGENKDILVPNSYFLENTITNWTRRDRRIRAQVTVGVAYGSPVDKVKELLLQAAGECDQILKTPQPFVLFNDFGDNALVFDVYFWIEVVGVMGRRIIQSTLRVKIDELLRAAGIVIAFPQRDVHLDAQGPLEVRLVEKE